MAQEAPGSGGHHPGRETGEAATARFLLGAVAVIVGAGVVCCFAIAASAVLMPSAAWALIAAMHALIAYIWLFVTVITLVLVWQLTTDRLDWLGDLQLTTIVSAVLSLVTLVLGNWLYGHHAVQSFARFSGLTSAERVVLESNQLRALFTLPLTVSLAFIAWRYGVDVRDRLALRHAVVVLQVLAALFLGIAFVSAGLFRLSHSF